LPSFTPCNRCIDGGDDDGLNDKEREKVIDENGESKTEGLPCSAFGCCWGSA